MTEEKKAIGKGLLGGFMDLFVETVPTAPATASGRPSEPWPQPDRRSAPPAVAVPDPDVVRSLEESVATGGASGYTTFLNHMHDLGEAIHAEPDRARAAIKIMSRTGQGLDALMEDIDKSVGILQARRSEFDGEVQIQVSKKVGKARSSIEDVRKAIRTKEEEAARILDEAESMKSDLIKLEAQASEDERKIRSVQAGFYASYDSVMERVERTRNLVRAFGPSGRQ